jgi:hypothetical protein
MDSEVVYFDPPATWATDFLGSRAKTSDHILANFRVLARTNAILRTADFLEPDA